MAAEYRRIISVISSIKLDPGAMCILDPRGVILTNMDEKHNMML